MKKSRQYWAILSGPIVTLALGFGITQDWVSVVKLLMLGIFGGFAAAQIFSLVRRNPRILFTSRFLVSVFFLCALTVPIIFSDSPIAQQIYGVNGRQLGFLHYLFLLLLLLGISTLNARIVWPQVIFVLAIVGIFQAGYGLLQFFGFDPIPWKNPDKWIFGTFGNPNYLSSFLALSTVSSIYIALSKQQKILKLVCFSAALFQVVVILLSSSTQGLILLAFGLFSILLIQSFQHSRFLGWLLLLLGTSMGVFGFLGIFQSGPLQKYLYQDSVSYRGDYWRAGLGMFRENWVHGVGLDSYGDYYKMYRDATAANRREIDITSNSAHNLFIDLAATGGILLLTGYLMILVLVFVTFLKTVKSKQRVTLEYKVLIILSLTFNLQTLISINVPALAVWGWIFSGLIIAYGNNGKYSDASSVRTKKSNESFPVIVLISCVVCVSLVSPLISRDVALKDALAKNDIIGITQAITSFPRDAEQIAQMAIAFENAGLSRESLELAWRAIAENPNAPRAWRVILDSQEAQQADKERAKIVLRRLDPFYVVR